MPRFAANISTMYQEHEFLDRIRAAADDGFTAVECQFPYDYEPDEIRDMLDNAGVEMVLLNVHPGDWATGERGLAAVAGREEDCAAAVDEAIEYAEVLGCPRVHLMAGIVEPDDLADHTYLLNLAYAATVAGEAGVQVLIEPLNSRDVPGYYLSRQEQAHQIVTEVGADNLKVQLDLYHCQITEGDLTIRLCTGLASGQVGHIQVAGVPDRHEPDTGEVDDRYVFELIDELRWDGWVGAEYFPRAGTSDGLDWFEPYRGRR